MKEALQNLKFVQGAVSDNRLDSTLSHFLIRDGYVTGFNGNMQITVPMIEGLEMAPKAKELVRALEQCDENVDMTITHAGNLRLVSGDFSAVVPTMPHEDMRIDISFNSGETIIAPLDILDTLQTIKPFISDDASRVWSTGVLFGGGYAYATNNIVIARMNTGIRNDWWFNMPLYVVNELLRINESPNCLIFHEGNTKLTVRYSGNRWLTATLGDMGWPNLNNILTGLNVEAIPVFTDPLIEAIGKVTHFTDQDNGVYITENAISTSLDPKDNGAIVSIPSNAITTTRYNVEMFSKLAGKGNMVDLSAYPAPAPFWNSKTGLFGAIVGMAV